jgi:lipopolysaccharide transport system permease protein
MNLFSNSIFWQLVSRSIRTDYLENLTGFAWLILQPLALLGVYAFVFTHIFSARIPDADDIGFVPYLAVAFWPWTAFSEAILKGSGTITGNAALIGKVAFPSELLPLSMVVATFIMQLTGYLAVLILLQLTGTDIHWIGVILAIPVLLLLGILASAITLFTSTLQVFVRDVAQMLPPMITLWFFTTPILYSAAVFPDDLAYLLEWNPMSWFVIHLRELIIFGEYQMGLKDMIIPVVSIALFWLALKFFRRFSGHFEDFL